MIAATKPVRPIVRVGSVLVAILLWQLASMNRVDTWLINFGNLPAPTDVARAAASFLQSPKVVHHVRNSIFRVFTGFGVATVVGITLGVAIGRSKRIEDVILPSIETLRPIPAVAWIPLAILMFPTTEGSILFITFIGALFPIVLNTIHGIEALDSRLILASRSLGARRWSVLREVVLPGALPSIVTGLRLGMGAAWLCLVTAEMIAGQYGIGYYTWESYNLQRYPDIVVGMVFIGVFGMLSSALINRLGQWLMPWYRPAKAET
ncbi:ABC transporter permease [Pendulispora albinea]|uniref:ABC transporter permease n=1 Tax=Pendulispora albinea TaxID=2741071 RepID=A0ABZ2LTY5_9BACT